MQILLDIDDSTKPWPLSWAIVGWLVIIIGIYLISNNLRDAEAIDKARREKELDDRLRKENKPSTDEDEYWKERNDPSNYP